MLVSYSRLSFFLLCMWLCPALSLCAAQTDDVLCRGGSGKFDADFHREARVHVGATKSGGLATRTCDAVLSSGGQEVTVASEAWEVDLDAFGVDLGMGAPVAAFQVKKSEADCCTTYVIYSLQKSPRLLRTLTGGSSFRATDVDFDTRVEIWTDDAAALDGFENLTFSEPDFLPPAVLRFEHNQLLDVGAEFKTYFDQLIAKLKGRIDARDLKNFKNSDGKLALGAAMPPEISYRLRKVKVGIVQIVWAYLNSGREHEAWATLADLWPGADVERIRPAIVKARERGVHAQADGVEATAPKKKRATIYDITMSEGDESNVVGPRPILLRRPPPMALEQNSTAGEATVDLIIDAAGKVHSAGSARSIDADLIEAAIGWKFIPAQRGGHAVACRTHMAVSLRR
jgi:hypothetical protein